MAEQFLSKAEEDSFDALFRIPSPAKAPPHGCQFSPVFRPGRPTVTLSYINRQAEYTLRAHIPGRGQTADARHGLPAKNSFPRTRIGDIQMSKIREPLL